MKYILFQSIDHGTITLEEEGLRVDCSGVNINDENYVASTEELEQCNACNAMPILTIEADSLEDAKNKARLHLKSRTLSLT